MRCLTRMLLLAAIALVAGGPVLEAQQKRPLSFIDIMELPLLGDPQLSPDGKRILFVMNRADWRGNRVVGHIYRINADGTGQVQLTFGDRGESMPRWSPDGRTIAFSARRDADSVNQIYLLESDGGEARRLTNHPAAPAALAWARDGKSLYFTATDAKNAEEREKDRVQDDVFVFEETNFKQRHLWTTDLEGRTKRVTQGDSFSVLSYDVSADGARVAIARASSPLLEHSATSEVWVMSADGNGARQLTTNEIPETNLRWSPDGATVAFTAGGNARFEPYYNDKIFLVPAAGGDARLLNGDQPFEVESLAWAPDGKSLFFLANHGLHNQLMRVDLPSGRASNLTVDDHALGNWSYADATNQHVFTRNTPARPSEIYTLSMEGDYNEPKRVTGVFDGIDTQYKLARQHRITWKGQDGADVEGLVYYPVDYVPGRRYPLIVYTHGGPEMSDKYGFSSDVQVYAGKGYAVLKPNYRGSTGYGDAFLRGMINGYFQQSHLDVMAGVDAVIAMGLADPDRLVKMGSSAGGHMTNKLISFTKRFKAASSFAGAANWISMYAQSDTRLRRSMWFGGTPWDANAPIELYWNQSPLKDVAKAKTPTLFLVGEQDPRVPMAQSVEMYRALRHHGVPTKLYVAPREGHGWGELRHRLFKYQVEMEWFEKYVNNKAYVWERVPGDEKKEPAKPPTSAVLP